MAKFKIEYPQEILNDIEQIYKDSDLIFGSMTRAGANVAMQKIKSSVPISKMAQHVKLTKTYKTPTDGGINTKVYFSGYLPFTPPRKTFVRRGKKGGDVYSTSKGIPADFLAIMFEYGRSGSPFPKKPFFRKSFDRQAIEKAMLAEQKKISGDLLNE